MTTDELDDGVGDRPHDVTTETSAGAPTVGTTYGYYEPERLSGEGPDVIIAHRAGRLDCLDGEI